MMKMGSYRTFPDSDAYMAELDLTYRVGCQAVLEGKNFTIPVESSLTGAF